MDDKRLLEFLRRHWDVIVLAAIVILGGYLRLSRLELMEFKGDEWVLHSLALKEAQGEFQLKGLLSSVKIHNPPMAVYLFAIPALFTKDPIVFAWLPAILGTLAIAGGYFLARKWMSRGAALGAMFLFAVSPWAILESRKIWAQDLLPFFTVAFFLSAVGWLQSGRFRYIVGAAAALAILNQVHYSTLALWPAAAFLVWRRASWAAAKLWLAGLALYLVLWAPFLVFLARGGAAEFGRHEVGKRVSQGVGAQLAEAMKWQPRLMGHGGFEVSLGRSAQEFTADRGTFPWLTGLFLLLLTGGAAAAVARAKREPEMVLVLLWLVMPMLVIAFHKVHFHYLIVCWPATFLAAGIFADAAASWVRKAIPNRTAHMAILAGAVAALLAVGAREVRFYRGFLDFVSTNGGTLGDYGTTYRDKLRVARYLEDLPAEDNFVLIDTAATPPSEDTYQYLYLLLKGVAPAVKPELRPVTSDTPVYVVLGPSVKGEVKLKLDIFQNAGTVKLGPLRVQRFLPTGAPAQP